MKPFTRVFDKGATIATLEHMKNRLEREKPDDPRTPELIDNINKRIKELEEA